MRRVVRSIVRDVLAVALCTACGAGVVLLSLATRALLVRYVW